MERHLASGAERPRGASANAAADGDRAKDPGGLSAFLTRSLAGNLLVLLALAIAVRAWQFGNPIIHADEQFYLLAGERILNGAVPYAEIWDSKPLGIFLVYAAIRALGGYGILEYQLAATLFALATALVIVIIARRFAGAGGALVAGAAYILFLPAFGGIGGQTPVFYNLFVVVAGLATFSLVGRPQPAARLLLGGAGIMLLLGLALQVKYSALFEGIFFGLALMWRCWADRRNLLAVFAFAAFWVGCALLPTGVLMLVFAMNGHFDAFMQGNFLSILGRRDPLLPAIGRLVLTIAMLTPLWICLWRALRHGGAKPVVPPFVQWWVAAALIGYLLFGSYYDHYTLPLLVPLTIACAPVLGFATRDKRRLSAILLGGALLIGTAKAVLDRLERGGRDEIMGMAAQIRPRLDGCLFVYEGDPILHKLTHSVSCTRFTFPGHLSNRKSDQALGVPVREEMNRILARRPAVVIMSETPRDVANLEARSILLRAVDEQYRAIATVPVGRKRWVIFERK